MAGLAPAIHVFLFVLIKTWMPGTIGERSDAVLRTAKAGHDEPNARDRAAVVDGGYAFG